MERTAKNSRAQENAHLKREIEKTMAEIDRNLESIRLLREASEQARNERELVRAETLRILDAR